jgi:hypothetical protein
MGWLLSRLTSGRPPCCSANCAQRYPNPASASGYSRRSWCSDGPLLLGAPWLFRRCARRPFSMTSTSRSTSGLPMPAVPGSPTTPAPLGLSATTAAVRSLQHVAWRLGRIRFRIIISGGSLVVQHVAVASAEATDEHGTRELLHLHDISLLCKCNSDQLGSVCTPPAATSYVVRYAVMLGVWRLEWICACCAL